METMIYGKWTIDYEMKPIPDRSCDWSFFHDSYDGPGNPLCGFAPTLEDAKMLIDELEELMKEGEI